MKLNTFYKQGAALALCLTLSFPVFAEKDLVQYVNTLQGTNSTYELSWGNTYPTTAVPYPMNSWSPQTGKNGDGWKYQYSATTIRGFQPTHQCSPWVGDYGVFSLMPVPELVVDESKRATPFSHDKEIAKPHYYKVTLENGITTEFSPTTRSAHFRSREGRRFSRTGWLYENQSGTNRCSEPPDHRLCTQWGFLSEDT